MIFVTIGSMFPFDRLIRAMDGYTALYRKGCTPPEAMTWGPLGNNESFLTQAVVMTPNEKL